MGRLENLIANFEKVNNNGGISKDEWIMFQLTNINVSLATIADCLSKERKQDGRTEADQG